MRASLLPFDFRLIAPIVLSCSDLMIRPSRHARLLSFLLLLALAPRSHAVVSGDDFNANTVTAINTLQQWYNGSGLWSSTGWWNAANCVDAVESAIAAGNGQNNGYLSVLTTTFNLNSGGNFLNGYYDDNCYFNCPPDFLPSLRDYWFLERYRRMRIVLATGENDICLAENRRLSEIMTAKGIPHWLDVWGDGTGHEWPWWQEMARKFF